MTDVALVIGVSRYQGLNDDLPGSVADALRFARWLIDAGAVRPFDIRLLLSRRPQDREDPPAHVQEATATRDSIVVAAKQLVQKSGDRMFVYFAGHGVSAEVNNAIVPVILPADFSWDLPDKSMTVDSLRAYFASHGFAQQYFFIDACRDLKKPDQPVKYGTFPIGGSLRIPAPQQFGLHATSPGLTASQLVGFQRETGAFTSALLEGLAGRAKILDENELKSQDKLVYRVTYQSLAANVIARVREARVPATHDLVQEPRAFGEHSSNPVLATFAVDRASPDCQRFQAQVTVAVTAPAEATVEKITFDGPFQVSTSAEPWRGELFHGTYWVKAHGPGLVNAAPWPMVEVSGPTAVTVALKKVGGLETTGKSIDMFVDAIPVRLAITTDDTLAMLEVVGPAGVIAAGFGDIVTDVWPGAYRIRMRGDAVHEDTLVVDRREQACAVHMTVPAAKPFTGVLAEARLLDDVSIAALAGVSKGIAASDTLHALAPRGDDDVTLRLGVIDGAARDDAAASAVVWRTWSVPVGLHALRVVDSAGRISRIPMHVIPDHTTSVVVAPAVAAFDVVVLFEPTAGGVPFDAWRTLVIAQRALARGDLRWARLALERDTTPTPARALAELALTIISGSADDVAVIAEAAASRWPAIPDFARARAIVRGEVPPIGQPILRLLAGDASRLVPRTIWAVAAEDR